MTDGQGRAPVRVLCVAGTRPNFVKVAPLLRAFASRATFAASFVHTGQHHQPALSDELLRELEMPAPLANLDVGSGTHAEQTAEIMRRFEPVLDDAQPEVVLVVGDVNSTLACALVAAKFTLGEAFDTRRGPRRRPLLVHVEAGLRSGDDDMPEEANRRIVDALSDLLYVSEPAGLSNLRREGIPDERVALVGNVMIDSLRAVEADVRRSSILKELELTGPYAVVTLHRPENVDDPAVLGRLLAALDGLSAELPLIFPVHPRTRRRLAANGAELRAPRWRLLEPLGYRAFIGLLASARVVLTDSGGVQEETTCLGAPCLTLRRTTERPITVEQGTNILAGTDRPSIESAFRRAMAGEVRGRIPSLWDGRAAERIADHLREVFGR